MFIDHRSPSPPFRSGRWLKDTFDVSGQIMPVALMDMMKAPRHSQIPARHGGDAANEKTDIATLQRAFDGES